MRKKSIAALFAAPLVLAGCGGGAAEESAPAISEVTPASTTISDPFGLEAAPEAAFGEPLTVNYSGEMRMTVGPSTAGTPEGLIPGGGEVVTMDVNLEYVSGAPAYHSNHLSLITFNGEWIKAVEWDPRMPNAELAPGETKTGPITFALEQADQVPAAVVYMTESGRAQAVWSF